MVSLLPFASSWIARTRPASSPVVFYAGLFVCIDIFYIFFEREVLTRTDSTDVSARMRRMARRRSIIVLASGYAGCVRCARDRLRSDMLRPGPPFAAGGRAWQLAVTTPEGVGHRPARLCGRS